MLVHKFFVSFIQLFCKSKIIVKKLKEKKQKPIHPPAWLKQKRYKVLKACAASQCSHSFWWEYKLVQSLWETVWQYLWKFFTWIPCDPPNPFLVIYTQQKCTLMFSWRYTSMVLAVLFAPNYKLPKCLLTEQINKFRYILAVEYYTAIRMKETYLHVTTWMNLIYIVLSK